MERRREDEFRNARGRRGERWEEDTPVGDPRYDAGPRSTRENGAEEAWREGRFPSGEDRRLRERGRGADDFYPPREFEGRQMGEPYRRGAWERDDDGGFRRFDGWAGTRGYPAARFSETSPFSGSSQGRFSHDYAAGATGGLDPGAGFAPARTAEYGFYEPSWRQGPHAGKGPAGYTRSDARIEEDLCDRLTDRGDIDASHIRIRVEGGEVTLEGDVHDRRTKRAAEDVAETVSGVHQVHNQLRIESHAGGELRATEGTRPATKRRR